MKPLAIGIRLLLGSFLAEFFGCAMAAPLFQPNVAQIDAPTGFVCPAPSSVFHDVPGLVLTMETSGNPVHVSFTATNGLSGNTFIQLRPVIDGRAQDDKFVLYKSGGTTNMEITLSMSRVFSVSKGVHTFGVQVSCPITGDTVNVFRSWLTVYELGSAVPKSDGIMKSPWSRP